MVFNATLNNISVTDISFGQFYWWRKPEYREKPIDQTVASYWQTLSHKVVSNSQL